MNIDKSLKNKKTYLLNYFRNRAEEFLSEIKLNYGVALVQTRKGIRTDCYWLQVFIKILKKTTNT